MATSASGFKVFICLFLLTHFSCPALADLVVQNTLPGVENNLVERQVVESKAVENSLLENRPVRLACNVFPPQKIALPSETAHPGYDIEIIQQAFLAKGLTTEFGFFPWKRAYLLVESGEYDALCSCSWRPEREKTFWFSDEMGIVSKGIFSLDALSLGKLADLREKSVGVVSGYNLEQELKAAGFSEIQSVVSDKLLLNLLLYKRVEVIYSFENTVGALLKKMNPRPSVQYQEVENAPYYLCISRAHKHGQQLLETFNSGLQKLKAEGHYEQIILRYLGE